MTEAPEQRKPRKTHGHNKCPRCGSKSLNKRGICASCGYGKSRKRND